MVLNLSIPCTLIFNHPLSFFIVNSLIIYSNLAIIFSHFKLLTLKQKLRLSISSVIWAIHHTIFLIFLMIDYILQQNLCHLWNYFYFHSFVRCFCRNFEIFWWSDIIYNQDHQETLDSMQIFRREDLSDWKNNRGRKCIKNLIKKIKKNHRKYRDNRHLRKYTTLYWEKR